jgi:hypothetical protein
MQRHRRIFQKTHKADRPRDNVLAIDIRNRFPPFPHKQEQGDPLRDKQSEKKNEHQLPGQAFRQKLHIGTGIAAFVGVGAIVGVSHADRASHRGYKMGHHKSMPMKIDFHDMRRHLYGIVDADGDEKLTQAEIDAAHAARRAKYDTDEDGNLSLSEFTGLWTELTQLLKIRGFQFLDTDGDGALSMEVVDPVTRHAITMTTTMTIKANAKRSECYHDRDGASASSLFCFRDLRPHRFLRYCASCHE